MIDYVRLSISRSTPLPSICEALMDKCLAPDSDWGGVGCDNMTVLIVALLGGRTKDEWFEWVKQRVESGEAYQTPKEEVDPFAQGPRGGAVTSHGIAREGEESGEEDEEGDKLDLPKIQEALRKQGYGIKVVEKGEE